MRLTISDLHFANMQEQEENVIAFLIWNEDLLSSLRYLRPYHFYYDQPKHIFKKIMNLRDEGRRVDINSMHLELNNPYIYRQLEELISENTFIGAGIEVVQNALSHFEAKMIQDYGLWKNAWLVDAVESNLQIGGDEIPAIMQEFYQRELNLENSHNTPAIMTAEMLHQKAYEQFLINKQKYINNENLGITTGFHKVDQLLDGGCYRSRLYLLGGRPGMGKTTLGINMLINAAKSGHRVGVLNLEMSDEELYFRAIASELGVPTSMYKTGRATFEQETRLRNFDTSQLKICVDSRNVVLEALRDRVVAMKNLYGIELLMIDHLGLIRVKQKTQNLYQEMSIISTSMKLLAKELDIAILALSQLSRGVEGRDDKHPLLSDLKDSGSLEADADVVIFSHRDSYYRDKKKEDKTRLAIKKDSFTTEKYEDLSTMQEDLIIVAKNRHGPTGKVKVYFDKDLTIFRDV